MTKEAARKMCINNFGCAARMAIAMTMIGMTLSVLVYTIVYNDPFTSDDPEINTMDTVTAKMPMTTTKAIELTGESHRFLHMEHDRFVNQQMKRQPWKLQSRNLEPVRYKRGVCPDFLPNIQPTNMNEKPKRGIFVDFIYNPNFYYELSVLKYMLMEIILRNPQTGFVYDYDANKQSTIIAIGHEHQVSRYTDRSVIYVKPKLLKDILYIDDIFKQIYNFLLSFFRICVRNDGEVPEYDRLINFKRYRDIFSGTINKIDESNKDKSICRLDEIYGLYNGQICIRPDYQAIEDQQFSSSTTDYWRTILHRISIVMNRLLTHTFDLTEAQHNCYEIKLRPETNIRRVLLFSHAAVKTASVDEHLDLHNYNRVSDDIILMKHRILHALGLGHRYKVESVMNSYDKPWQQKNLFTILEDDYQRLSQCYSINGSVTASVPYYVKPVSQSPNPYFRQPVKRQNPKRYVTKDSSNSYDLRIFVNNFEEFMYIYNH